MTTVALAMATATSAEPTATEPATEPKSGERLFALDVLPLFQEKCLACHGRDPDKIEGGLDMRTRAALLSGGEDTGRELVIPGDAARSRLTAILDRSDPSFAMPPKEADRLTAKQRQQLREWIEAGAPWPDDATIAEIRERFAVGVTVATSGGLSEAWTTRRYDADDLWAFRPLPRDFPVLREHEFRSPVDAFVNRRLEELGIEPAPPADRRTLIRRVTFDLLGLPPTPEEIREFLADPRGDDAAYAALVDRLLDSPHYGEQAARHWLDVVRYADSSGFANDYERPNAWRYRDYVIRAFNDDLPFDRFVREQLAGDELIEQAERDGTPLSAARQSELRIAVGFLRMGPWEHTGMSVAKVARQLFLDDVTDTVGQVFLGQALQCCRCHDHKFDPIPTRDYYAFQAAFATTQFAESDAPWLDSENLAGMDEDRADHDRKHQANEALLKELEKRQRSYEAAWFAQRGLPYKTKAEARKAGAGERDLPTRTFMTADEYGRERIARKWRNRFEWEFDRYQPIAFTVYNGNTKLPNGVYGPIRPPRDPWSQGEPERTAILVGGDPFAPSDTVAPGVLSAVNGCRSNEIPDAPTGRRLALADWIVDPGNPLTPRVLVNRIWSWHFGQGLAGNPNNFGTTGKKPTHPELLDWLAGEFIAHGRSIKHLHRVILMSDAYRRSGTHPSGDDLHRLDPTGTSYAAFRPRRLAAEELRDTMLAVSGEWNPLMGGLPARPDMNLEAALQPRMIMGTFAPSYVPDRLPERRNRRTIYVQRIRGQGFPFLETFNQPGSERPCELRDQSNVAPQAFSLLNGREPQERALAFASRVLKETDAPDAAVARAFELAFGRPPSDEETALTLEHWRRMTERQSGLSPEPFRFPTEVLREANEENTGETFTFTERLFVYEDYIPDLQPHQTDAKTRGLADVCLMLLNANELIYVY